MTLVGERVSGGERLADVAVGEVVELSREQVELGPDVSYTRRLVRVGDLSDDHADARDEFNRFLDALSELAAKYKDKWEVPTEENNFQTNPARSMFYSRFPGNRTMLEWQKDILKAKALYPLQKPHDAQRVLPDGVDDYAMAVFMFAMDSIGIRSRAAIMKQVGLESMSKIDDPNIHVLSLGTGAAVPLIDVVSSMRDDLGKSVKMDVCDVSQESLDLADELMREANIPPEDVDAYTGSFIRKLHEMKKSGKRVNMVEALGLFEYLKDKDASNLIEKSYDLLEPGGVIVVSNMLSDRPQLEFNQYAVGWPYVLPRSEAELVQLALDAGIDPSEITITIAEDGVYAVMEIRKP